MARKGDVAVPLVGNAARAVGGAQLEELGALALEVQVRMRFELPEVAAEGEVLVGAQMLAGEEQHHVLEQQLVDDPRIVLGRLAERDATDLGTQRAREPPHVEVGQGGRCVHGPRA